ncbi:MAG: hypothetical protein RLZZ157_1261 [Pseudomonadota bacterium]|jgi:predicted Fe-S protein YdhL (DUF1289 family)
MSGFEALALPITSPCIQVCCVEPKSGLCLGCYRTLAEIATWGKKSETERADILTQLPSRIQRLDPIYWPKA